MPLRVRTLADLGEAALIERIAKRAGGSTSRSASAKDWLLGIGDDAAILRPRPGSDLVFSVDAQVENVHFRFGRETPTTIGRRALAVNLSDLAAMGATPVGALLSLAAPAALPLARFDALIEGFVAESECYRCPLIGGNLTRAEDCSLHVTVIGRVARGAALRRGTLRAGDELYVTGHLGAAALARHRADRRGGRLTRVPVPRLETGEHLARSPSTSACIDLSDGLATDLGHLLASSGLGAQIDVEALPLARGFERGCAALDLDPRVLAVSGGEDYELLFARRPDRGRRATRTGAAYGGVPITRIGRVTVQPGIRGLPPGEPPGHHF
jgi:thiamine-monophosphate kinase